MSLHEQSQLKQSIFNNLNFNTLFSSNMTFLWNVKTVENVNNVTLRNTLLL